MQYLQVKYAKMGQNCMNMYIKTQTLRKYGILFFQNECRIAVCVKSVSDWLQFISPLVECE